MNEGDEHAKAELRLAQQKFLKQCLYTVLEFAVILALPAIFGLVLSHYFGHKLLILIIMFVLSWVYIIRKVLRISRQWNRYDDQLK